MPAYQLPKGQSVPDVTAFDAMGPLGLPAVLVSLFRSKALREAATLRTVEALKGTVFGEAAENLAKRFPRVTAHMNPKVVSEIPSAHPALGQTLGQVEIPYMTKVTGPMKVKLNSATTPERARETLFHEATHVAQAWGTRRWGRCTTCPTSCSGT